MKKKIQVKIWLWTMLTTTTTTGMNIWKKINEIDFLILITLSQIYIGIFVWSFFSINFFFSHFFFAHHHHHHLRTAWMNILHQEKKLGFLPSYKSIMLMFVYGCWEKTFLNSFTSHGNQFSFFSDDDGDTFTTTSKDFEIIINIDWSCFWNMRITK